jgi:hypothetical protein
MVSANALFGIWGTRILLFLFVCAVFASPIYDFVHPQLALNERGIQTIGRIVALEPNNHSSIKYEYRVGDSNYSGEWGPWNLEAARVGENVTVTYLPDQPRVSVAGKPNVEGWWVLPFVVLPGMGALAAFFGTRQSLHAWWTRQK